MPRRVTTPMSEKLHFIEDLETTLFTMTELCDQYGISCKPERVPPRPPSKSDMKFSSS
jgi:hypothetical protein